MGARKVSHAHAALCSRGYGQTDPTVQDTVSGGLSGTDMHPQIEGRIAPHEPVHIVSAGGSKDLQRVHRRRVGRGIRVPKHALPLTGAQFLAQIAYAANERVRRLAAKLGGKCLVREACLGFAGKSAVEQAVTWPLSYHGEQMKRHFRILGGQILDPIQVIDGKQLQCEVVGPLSRQPLRSAPGLAR